MSKIAVVGAGISGLVVSRTLSKAGLVVDLFEKSRGLSGRLSTRRSEGNQVRCSFPTLSPSTSHPSSIPSFFNVLICVDL